MRDDSRILIAVVLVALVGGGAFIYWKSQLEQAPAPAAAPPPVAPPVVPVDTAPVAPPPPAAPVVQHPIGDDRPRGTPLPALAESDGFIARGLIELVGKKGLGWFNVDGFARRVVTTVDNLANERARFEHWPVKATPGNFAAQQTASGYVIAGNNNARYKAFVQLAEAIDMKKAAGLYVRVYPLLQEAYEDLGYPGKYFNDRVVEVIDHLLATPEPQGPVAVRQVEINEPGQPRRVSRLYQFADPTLEARSAGQKVLLRVGPENAAKLKAQLRDIRQLITRPATERKLER